MPYVIQIKRRCIKKPDYFQYGRGKNSLSPNTAFHFPTQEAAQSVIDQSAFIGAEKVEIIEVAAKKRRGGRLGFDHAF